jgi:hypothetical protein
MTEAQTYNEVMREMRNMQLTQQYNSLHNKKARGSNISSQANNYCHEDAVNLVNKLLLESTFGDTPVKLRLQEKLKNETRK